MMLAVARERFGRYRLLDRLAVGGMGEVYLARHDGPTGADRLVVVKRILPHLTRDPDFVDYFVHEGRISSLLNHPNVVRTLEVGRVGERYYIAMEHVPGPTLVRLLSHGVELSRQLSIHLVFNIACKLARALSYIHERADISGNPYQIIHMDLAPHNILITDDGEPKLLDFGIARINGQRRLRRDFRGRAAYLAPEQIDGLAVDQRVDLFALGTIMYEMVVGRPLFRSRTESMTVTRILHARILPPHQIRRDCPEALSRVILRALQRDRRDRFQTATEVLDALEQVAVSEGIVPSTLRFRREIAEMTAAVSAVRVGFQHTPSSARRAFGADQTTVG